MALTASTAFTAQSAAVAAADPDPVQQNVAAAERIAGSDLRQPLFLCQANGGGVVARTMATESDKWVQPTKAFDNLFFVGNGFVGVWVLKTSAGLILFDSGKSEAEARDHIVPGITALGLDPKTIRYVVVTHGHYDHFGGASWFQRELGARIALSTADWDLIEHPPQGAQGIGSVPRPRRDLEVADGDVIRLGDTSVSLTITPGHTPGTISAIVPAREGSRTHPLSLLGSTAFPANVEPSAINGGLRSYDQSVLRFAKISADAKAEGIINTHGFADGTLDRLTAARARKGGANPFLTGAAFTARYYDLLHHCLLAAQARASR